MSIYAMRLGLDDQGGWALYIYYQLQLGLCPVRFPRRNEIFFCLSSVQTGGGMYPASCPLRSDQGPCPQRQVRHDRNLSTRLSLVKSHVWLTLFVPCATSRPLLWSSGRRSGFDSRRYQIFWEVVGVCNGVHSASCVQLRGYLAPVYKAEDTAVGIRHSDTRDTVYPQKLALTSFGKRRSLGRRPRSLVLRFFYAMSLHGVVIN
jgi:hypothetical protein